MANYAPNKIRPAPTPFLDESTYEVGGQKVDSIREGEEVGEPAHISARVLMRIMHMARFAGFDLLRAVGPLTNRITKWDKTCDREHVRMIISYEDPRSGD